MTLGKLKKKKKSVSTVHPRGVKKISKVFKTSPGEVNDRLLKPTGPDAIAQGRTA